MQKGCKGFKFYNTMLCYVILVCFLCTHENCLVTVFISVHFVSISSSYSKLIYSSWLGVRDYIHVVDLAKGHIAAIRKLKDSCGCKVRHFFILFDVLFFTSLFLSFTFLSWSLWRFITLAQVQVTQCYRWWMPWKKLQVERWVVNLLWSKAHIYNLYMHACIYNLFSLWPPLWNLNVMFKLPKYQYFLQWQYFYFGPRLPIRLPLAGVEMWPPAMEIQLLRRKNWAGRLNMAWRGCVSVN